ncbi:MAG TPA: hypothetical protein VK762_02070 [Polyangiaceae bacterium]|nr:hypothetical protein [Polyangiaceae bacterium]
MNPNFERRPLRARAGTISIAALLCVALGASEARAQPAAPDSPAPDSPPAAAPPVDDRLARQQAQIDALVAKSKEQDAQVAALKEQAATASDDSSSFSRLLSFWGFSDLSFGGMDFDNDHALYKVQTPSKLTFFSSGINLYAKSEMTRTLSALVETRLTYSPNGYASDWPAQINVGSTTIQSQGSLTRVDTTTRGPYSQLEYRQDGLLIERAYMEWKPTDWFGARVGRFLTPFGIWNEDHGSPVLIGVDYPQFMNFNIVPIWQLGAEVFGSVELTDDLRAEYALTVANSRGPEDEYKDLTNMKAIGARVKLVYNPEPLLFRIGGYAYYNHYRDTQDNIQIQLTPALTLDPAYSPSFGSYTTVNSAYDETVITGDAEIRIRRLRIIAEFARQTVIYEMPTQVDSQDKLLKGVPFNTTIYDPSHYGLGGYVMAAYEIPFHTAPLDFTVMPYAGYDYVAPSTTVPVRNNVQIRGGLNVKPSPYVTLKVEVSRLLPENKSIASAATAVMSQIAFSF